MRFYSDSDFFTGSQESRDLKKKKRKREIDESDVEEQPGEFAERRAWTELTLSHRAS